MTSAAGQAWWEKWTNAYPETRQITLTATGSGVQVMLLPCFPPLNGRARLLAVKLSNGTAAAAVVTLWDAYLSDPTGFTTSGIRGSNAAPIYQCNVPVSGDVNEVVLTRPYFQCGIVAQTTQQPMFISVQVGITALG